MLGAYKKHPQAYFLYVEDCFLLSDNADASYISKGVRKFAAAVVLSIQPQFFTELNGLQIPVFFLKIARQPSALVRGKLHADFVDFCCAFKRAKRKCCTKKIEILSRCLAYRCCQPEPIAAKASLSAFRAIRIALRYFEELFMAIVPYRIIDSIREFV